MRIKRKTLQNFKKWFLRIFIISVVVLVWYVYTFTSLFAVTSYTFTGVDEEKVQLLNESLVINSHTYTFGIIPNDKVLSYSNASIIRTVTSLIPELKSIDMRPVGLHTVHISITEFVPVLKVDQTTAVTNNGILFTTNKDLSQYPFLTIASSTIHVVKNGDLSFSQFDGLEPGLLANISEFEKKISAVIFPVYLISIDETGDISLNDQNGNTRVLATKDSDLKKSWSTLLSAIDTDPLKTQLAKEKDRLEYLDVRFGNKIFYKFSTTPFQISKDTAILGDHATSTDTTGSTSTSLR